MSPLGVVVAIVLVDLLGFSLVMPLLAPFAEEYGFRDWQIGLLYSAYPMCQLVAGPVLGRLSDRYGRRPLLVASQAGKSRRKVTWSGTGETVLSCSASSMGLP